MTDPTPLYLFFVLLLLGFGAWYYGQGQAVRLRLVEGRVPHSRSPFHGALCAGAALVAGVAGLAIVQLVSPSGPVALSLVALVLPALLAAVWAGQKAGPRNRARVHVERIATIAMASVASLAVLVTLGIVLSLLFEALLFFADVSILEFLFGTRWAPRASVPDGALEGGGAFGSVPVFAGTAFITIMALAFAAPLGLMIAVYLSEYASPRARAVLKPTIEVLAGIPPVVYGVFALIAVGPLIRDIAMMVGLSAPVQSALAAAIVMGVMVLPLISSLSDDVINAVPQSLRDGSLALGATKSETVRGVVVPSAAPGIAGAFLLAISRAVGETMIVVLVAGRGANLTANPLETVTTVTVQIVALLTGDQVFDSAKTRAAFALGLVLFCATLALNLVALLIVRRYRGVRA